MIKTSFLRSINVYMTVGFSSEIMESRMKWYTILSAEIK